MKKGKINKKWVRVLPIIFIVLFILVVGIKLSVSFSFKGEKYVDIPYRTTYEEKGCNLKIFGLDKTKTVKITNRIDTEHVGKYKVIYSYKLGFFKINKERIVTVVDKDPPVITLEGEIDSSVCPEKDYQEDGYTAKDEYDGDITDKVKVNIKDGKKEYKVEDSSGNKTVITRNIIHEDKEKPVITLKGNTTIYLTLGSKYNDPGYSAQDNCDGDLTSLVQITGSVDSNKTGTYTISYQVKDKIGNESKTNRKVIVYQKNDTNNPIGAKGVIYLTFDDGPIGSGSTSKILDVLKSEGVKATFFVTGSGPDSLIKREAEEGHTVALHTYSHKYDQIYKSVDAYFTDLTKIQNRVESITGIKSTIIRFPGGTNNTVSKNYSKGIMSVLSSEVLNRGFKNFDWNVDASDAWQCAKSSVKDKKKCVYNNVVKGLSKKRVNIVLMHDIKSYTADALKDIITYGKNNGYTFEAITNETDMYRFKPSN